MSIYEPVKALEHCEAEVTKKDIGHYIHGRFLPPEIRPYYYAVHALRLEMLKTRESMQNSTLKSGKLTWWLENLEGIWDGTPAMEPISIALKELRKYHIVRKSHFERMIRGRLQETDIKTWENLDWFIDNNYTMSFYILLELFHLYEETEFQAATFAGRSWGIYNLLLMTKYYLDRGRCYLPEELLIKHSLPLSVTIEDETNQTNKVPESFYDVVLEVATYGKKNLEKAREYTLPKHANLVFLPLVEAEKFYNRLEKHNFNVLDPKALRSPWASVFWKMTRHLKRGTF